MMRHFRARPVRRNRRWIHGPLGLLAALLLVLPAPGAGAGGLPNDASGRMRTWYFAEGNSRRDFQTFFTLLNLTDQPASVTAAYDRDDGIRLMQWLGIEPKGRV